MLFCGVRFSALLDAVADLRFLTAALLANFVAVPLLGYSIASWFLLDHPAVFVGLVIYFMSPCTDWFLSFTRLSGGNVAIGTALIPINLTMQLLLYPLYLHWFTENTVQVDANTIASSLLNWFIVPLLAAVTAHQVLRLTLQANRFDYVLEKLDRATPWVTSLLVMQMFCW